MKYKSAVLKIQWHSLMKTTAVIPLPCHLIVRESLKCKGKEFAFCMLPKL